MATSIGELFATMVWDDRQFKAGIARTQASLKGLDSNFGRATSAMGRSTAAAGKTLGGFADIVHRDFGPAAKTAGINVRGVASAFSMLAVQATGANPAVVRLANVVGSFAIGGVFMAGAVAGVAALGFAWDAFTKKAREASEETERVIAKLLEAAALREGGLGAAEKQDIAQAQANLDMMAGGYYFAESWANARQALVEAETAYGAILAEDARKRKEAASEAASTASKAASTVSDLNDSLLDLNARAALAGDAVGKMMAAWRSGAKFGPVGFNATQADIEAGKQERGAEAFARKGRIRGADSIFTRTTTDKPGAGGATTGENIMAVVGKLGSAFKGIISALNPWQFLLEAVQRALGDFIVNMTPVVEILAAALMPILKALFPIFKMLAIAATYVGQVLFEVAGGVAKALGALIYGLGVIIKWIPGDNGLGEKIKGFGQSIIDLGNGFGDSADELANARDEIKGLGWQDALDPLAEAARDTAEALRNVPEGFKVAQAIFDATMGRSAPGAAAMAGGGTSNHYGDVYIDANSKPTSVAYDEWVQEQARRGRHGGGSGYTDRGGE